jgi:hypothetical protein
VLAEADIRRISKDSLIIAQIEVVAHSNKRKGIAIRIL